MTATPDAHLTIHRTRHAELVDAAARDRLARSVRRDAAPTRGATVLRFLDRLSHRRGTPIATPRSAS